MAHDFNLQAPDGANKRKRILGRGHGSGRGKTSGKGHKGQKARSGGKTYSGFEGGQMPLYRRLAQRGFSNYPFRKTWQIVNLSEIDKRYLEGETVDEASLFEKGLIKGRKKAGSFTPAHPVKILGNGDLSKKLIFKIGAAPTGCAASNGCAVSASAREKIEKSGGELAAGTEAASEKSGGKSGPDLSAQ